MENGKEPLSLSPPYLGALPSPRNQVPRVLVSFLSQFSNPNYDSDYHLVNQAPLKRAPKLEPIVSSKPILNPIVPASSQQNLRAENVRDVSFSTFKPNDSPVLSLLPTDQLFDKPLRPVSASPSTRSILPPAKAAGTSDNKLNDATGKDLLRDPSTNDKVSNRPVTADQAAKANSPSKPAAGLSFTERLAAKKASRFKNNEAEIRPATTTGVSQVAEAKKHVQFDFESAEVRQYTPEYSEEASKVADKSDSSSSEEFLDFRDPGLLKPLSDLSDLPMFEEKRWDVSLTSFSMTSPPKGSPVKSPPAIDVRIDDVRNDEMVTRFNSEYCPSPLPVKTPLDPLSSTSGVKPILEVEKKVPFCSVAITSSPVIEETAGDVVLVNSPPMPTTLKGTISEGEETSSAALPLPLLKDISREIDDAVPITPVVPIVQRTVEDVKLESVQRGGSTRKDRPSVLTRGFARSDSLEATLFPAELTGDHASEASNQPVKSAAHWNIEPTVEPSSLQQKIVIKVSPSVEALEESLPFTVPKAAHLGKTGDDSSAKLQEEWLRMKRQMEMALEDEKAKLEGWFNREISQIKRRFESELASERQRTEELCKLVESSKKEKEKATMSEILRLEEKLAHFVDEKSREALQPASPQRQDANIQTEPDAAPSPPPPPAPLKSETFTDRQNNIRTDSRSNSGSQVVSPVAARRESRGNQCHCDSLQRQVARVEREMQLLKQKNLSVQKNTTVPKTKKKSTPVKAQRESWWVDSDMEETTESTSSFSDWRASSTRGRSRSLTNLYTKKETSSVKRSVTPVQRARGLLYKNQVHKRAVRLNVNG